MTDSIAFQQIVQILQQAIGLAPNCLSDRALTQVIQQRQVACSLPDFAAYRLHLSGSAIELKQLVEAIVVSETWFFRDYQPFMYLAQFVQEWLPHHRYRRLRVLSLPCATGEEPYSIAITLLEAGLPSQRFQIDAVDVSDVALEKAKRAIYEKHSFREKRFVERDRYFQFTSAGYQVKSEIQSTVNFRQANLLDPHAFVTASNYDVIFCRNLLIYLDPTARTNAIATLSQLLTDHGILFVGHSELSLLASPKLTKVRHPFTFAVRKVQVSQANSDQSVAPSAQSPQPSFSKPPAPSPIAPSVPRRIPSPIPSTLTPSTLQQAKELANKGQLPTAIDLCQSYLAQFPTNSDAHVLLGTIQQAIGQDAAAAHSFQQALYLDPHHEEALMYLLLLKEQAGDQLQAENFRQRLQRLG
jgi:chemotaxis protein methyltransferase WspC